MDNFLKNFEIIQYIGISLGIAFLLIGLLLAFQFFSKKNTLKEIKKRKVKTRKKKIKLKRKIAVLENEKKTLFRSIIIFLFLSLSVIALTMYGKYYVEMNLDKNDEEEVVNGYYLLVELEKELNNMNNTSEEDSEKYKRNILYLSNNLSSYAIKTPNKLNSENGQKLLKSYYAALSELGQNTNSQVSNFANNQELIDTFLKDISDVQKRQKKAFEYYKVDEKALKEK